MSYSAEIPQALIDAHWQMVESLFTEFMLFKRNELALKGEYLQYLMSDASRDPRFEAIGLGRHPKGYMLYTSPLGLEYEADAAPAAMLGLDMVSEKPARTSRGDWTTQCTKLGMNGAKILYRKWECITDFQWWLRWRAQQSRGYTDKALHLNTGYTSNRVRDFPDTLQLINELYPKKD